MSLGTPNRDGGKTSESAHLRALTKGFRGEVLNGLAVSQRGAGANMSVDIAIGDAIIPRSDGTYSHPAFNDAVLNQVIATADPSNPRRDIVVMYVDYGQAPSTGVSNNTNGVIKVKVVAGTPAGSPVDPTDTAIQTSVGAGNPFIKLARARVGAGVTSIGNSVIDDLRRMGTAHVQGGWLYEYQNAWVYVSASSFKIAGVDVRTTFPVGTKIQLYQGSVVKYFVVTATAFSTDTTITVDGRGTYTLANDIIDHPAYSYVLNPTGYPFGGVQASNVDFTSLTPAAPVQLTAGQSFGGSAAVTGASLTFVADGIHQYELCFTAPQAIGTAANNRLDLSIIKDGATTLGFSYNVVTNSSGGGTNIFMRVLDTPAAGSHTYTMNGVLGTGSGSAGFYCDATSKAIFSVRVIR